MMCNYFGESECGRINKLVNQSLWINLLFNKTKQDDL